MKFSEHQLIRSIGCRMPMLHASLFYFWLTSSCSSIFRNSCVRNFEKLPCEICSSCADLSAIKILGWNSHWLCFYWAYIEYPVSATDDLVDGRACVLESFKKLCMLNWWCYLFKNWLWFTVLCHCKFSQKMKNVIWFSHHPSESCSMLWNLDLLTWFQNHFKFWQFMWCL